MVLVAALAEYLAERGAKLILSSNQRDQLESVRSRLPHAEKHQTCLLDFEQPENIDTKVQSILTKTGPIDILVNNAGIAQHSLVIETQLAVDRRIMEINFFRHYCYDQSSIAINARAPKGDKLLLLVVSQG